VTAPSTLSQAPASAQPIPTVTRTRRSDTTWARLRDTFTRNPLYLTGLIVAIAIVLIAIFAYQLAPYGYDAFNRRQPLKPPSATFWFGTDRQTRDMFSRVLVGARVTLSVGLVATTLIMTIGVVLGAIAGYFGGIVDNAIMRITDLVLAIPQFFLLIAVAALFSPSLTTTMIVIGLTSWMSTARLVRGEFLRLKSQEYVLAARALGSSPNRIVWRHIFPNTIPVIIVQATLWLSSAMLLESSLSFLGLGAQPPTPSWGGMLANGRTEMQTAWWQTVFPGLAIFLTVIAFNLVGEGLRDALDPRSRRR